MNQMLTPVVALILWSLVVWLAMLITRLPAVGKAGVSLGEAKFPDSMTRLPGGVRQIADNYNHLMEQPTIFYALVFCVVLSGASDQLNVCLAWGYVGLRVAHSLIQCTINTIILRLPVFILSSLILAAMAAREAVTLL